MAFFLGLGLELLEGVSAFVGESVVGSTGSEALGAFASNNVKGFVIGTAVNTGVKTAEEALNKISGADITNQAQDVGSTIYNYQGSYSDPFNGNSLKPFNRNRNSSKPQPSMNNEAEQHQNQTQDQVDYLHHDLLPTSLKPFTNDSVIFNPMDTNDDKFQKVFNYAIDREKPQSPATQQATELGQQLGTLIGDTTNTMISKKANPIDAYKQALSNYPVIGPLMGSVISYQEQLKDVLPQTQRFKDIYQLFKGRSLSTKSVQMKVDPMTGLKIFTGIDEFGQQWVYNENPNAMKVPTINGVWTGMNSPNNALPTNVLDVFSYFHDCEYHLKMFDLDADYRLISRIVQNLDRMGAVERAKAIIAVKYFSSIGHTIALYKNEDNPSKSFFQTQVAPQIQHQNSNYIGYSENTSELESYFNDGLEKAIVSTLSQNSPMGNPNLMKAQVLEQIIDNLTISL